MDLATLGTGITILLVIVLFLGVLIGIWLSNERKRNSKEKEPPRVIDSDPRTWDELQVSMEEAQRESAP